MTWDITIGRREVVEDMGEDEPEYFETVIRETHPLAPQFDIPTGQSNFRSVSIGVVASFLQEAGLEILATFAGVIPLDTKLYQIIYEALIAYRAQHLDAQPGWGDRQDPVLARLEWFNWWCYYTLGTYKGRAAICFSI